MNVFIKIGLLLLLPFIIFSQRGWEVGGQLGVSHYLGDLNTNYDFSKLGPSAGFNVRYNFGHRICFKSSLNYGWVHADDADSPNIFEQTRNLNFKSHLFDLSGAAEFNFLPYIHGSYTDYFTPYFLLGASVVHFNPYTYLNDEREYLQNYGTEGQAVGQEYIRISPALLVGGGMKWDINYEWSINVEYGMRIMHSDYMDDVSGTYPGDNALLQNRGEKAVLLSDRSGELNIGQKGRQRGNVTDRDKFGYLTIGVMRFFGRIECPDISKRQAQSWL